MIRLAEFLAGNEYKTFFDILRYSIYFIFAYLQIDIEVMSILSLLMFVDTICGTAKSLRLGNSFSFKKLGWGFVSKFLILIIPMVVALMGKPLHKDFTWVVDVSIRILIINEGLSVLANIISVYKSKDVQNVDLVSRLINWIRLLGISLATKLMNTAKLDENENNNNN